MAEEAQHLDLAPLPEHQQQAPADRADRILDVLAHISGTLDRAAQLVQP